MTTVVMLLVFFSTVVCADGPSDESSVAAMVKAMAQQNEEMANQKEAIVTLTAALEAKQMDYKQIQLTTGGEVVELVRIADVKALTEQMEAYERKMDAQDAEISTAVATLHKIREAYPMPVHAAKTTSSRRLEKAGSPPPSLATEAICAPEAWVGYDGETCGECAALVKVRDNGGTCTGFCSLQGLNCVEGWNDETGGYCSFDATVQPCDHHYASTSDAICKCTQDAVTPVLTIAGAGAEGGDGSTNPGMAVAGVGVVLLLCLSSGLLFRYYRSISGKAHSWVAKKVFGVPCVTSPTPDNTSRSSDVTIEMHHAKQQVEEAQARLAKLAASEGGKTSSTSCDPVSGGLKRQGSSRIGQMLEKMKSNSYATLEERISLSAAGLQVNIAVSPVGSARQSKADPSEAAAAAAVSGAPAPSDATGSPSL